MFLLARSVNSKPKVPNPGLLSLISFPESADRSFSAERLCLSRWSSSCLHDHGDGREKVVHGWQTSDATIVFEMASLFRILSTNWRPRLPKRTKSLVRSLDGPTILRATGISVSFGCAIQVFRAHLLDWTVRFCTSVPISTCLCLHLFQSADMSLAT